MNQGYFMIETIQIQSLHSQNNPTPIASPSQ